MTDGFERGVTTLVLTAVRRCMFARKIDPVYWGEIMARVLPLPFVRTDNKTAFVDGLEAHIAPILEEFAEVSARDRVARLVKMAPAVSGI